MFKMLKNQKGMTLVELLAVMVIVGIIAAISIPAIGTLLENSRKDAYISSAVAVQEAARLYATSNDAICSTTCTFDLKATDSAVANANLAYIDNFKVAEYSAAKVVITKDATGKSSYVTTLTGVAGGYQHAPGDATTFTRTGVSKVSQ